MLIQIRANLNSLQKADWPPGVLCALFILKRQCKFVFVVIRPGDNSVTLSTKLVKTINEAAMQKHLLCSIGTAGTLCIILHNDVILASSILHHIVHTVHFHLVVNTVLADYLNVVLFTVLTKQKSEATRTDIFPSVLLV